MADPTAVAVLTFFHILAAMGWLGGVLIYLSAVGPGVRSFTPSASLEFLAKVGPKQIRFFAGSATGTIVFGLALLYAAFGSDYSSWPWYIDVGLSLGLLAYLVSILVTTPAFKKLGNVARAMSANPGPAPPEFARLLKRGNMAAALVAIILIFALVFMVSSAVFA